MKVLPLATSLFLWGLSLSVQTPLAQAQCEMKLVANDAAVGDLMGRRMAVSGDVMIVGGYPFAADDGIGIAYVFRKTANGWTQEQELVGSDVQVGDSYGWVAIDGNTAVVGAATQSDSRGAAYVFHWNGIRWLEVQKLSPSVLQVGDYFGGHVAVSGTDLVVGAHGRASGASFAYERVGTQWVLRQELQSSSPNFGDKFGFPVYFAGQSLIISASDDEVAGQTWAGAVYVFEKVGGSWVEVQRVTSSAPSFGHGFGLILQVFEGGFAVGGSPFGASGTSVFEHDGLNWVEVASLFPVASAPSPGLPGQPRVAHAEGDKVHLFRREAGTWVAERVVFGSDSQVGDYYGSSTWIEGSELFVGSPWADDSATNGGTVFVHDIDCLNSFEAFGHCSTEAPCANHDPQAGCTNSSGSGALLATTAESTNSVSADDLRMVVTNVPSGTFGLVYMGPNRAQVAFGDGLRAVEPGPPFSFYRFAVQVADGAGSYAAGPGLVAWSHAQFDPQGAIHAGSTWMFQGYYRDLLGPCGSGFNLTNGLSVDFIP